MTTDSPDQTKQQSLVRPRLTFETITFSDGQTLSLGDDDIIVFVGPNNAGKSAALRELYHYVGRTEIQKVITGVTKKTGGRPQYLPRLA